MTREPLPAVDWSIFRPGHSPIELSLSSPWTDTADGAVKLGRTHPATGTEVDAHETDDRNATAEEGRKQKKDSGGVGQTRPNRRPNLRRAHPTAGYSWTGQEPHDATDR